MDEGIGFDENERNVVKRCKSLKQVEVTHLGLKAYIE